MHILDLNNIIKKKESISLSLIISSIFCFYIISGNESLQGVRFTASWDGTIIYKTIFDLINSLSGGNSSWSIFDLANRTFISFGAISHNLYSFPVAIIYFIFHKLFPNIPENILYRNVFIFTFFPLVNLVMTFGYNLWLSKLKINNFIVSVLLIPFLMMLFGNEIWGLLYTSPVISLLPFLLISTNLLIEKKFNLGLIIFFVTSLICFMQLPLLFIAYILPFPWLILIVYGIINFFRNHPSKLDFKNKYLKAIIISFLLSLITAIPKIALSIPLVIERVMNKFNMMDNVINSNYLYEFLNIISQPYLNGNGFLFGLISKIFFFITILLIHYIAFLGIIKKNFNYKNTPIFIKKYLNSISNNKLSYKLLLFLALLFSFIFLFEIFFIIKDLRENYYADSSRLNAMFDISQFHRRNFANVFPKGRLIPDLLDSTRNTMLNGRFGYVGIPVLSLIFIGIVSVFRNKNNKYLKVLFLMILIIMSLNTSHVFLATIIFTFSSLLYPFSFLQNNLSMFNYQLDYLFIPFIVVGFSNTIYFINERFKEESIIRNFKHLKILGSFFIPVLTFLITITELSKVKKYIKLGEISYDKFKFDNGIINNKRRDFLIDAQNPILKTVPLYNYFGNLPTVKKEKYKSFKLSSLPKDWDNWKNYDVKYLKSYGTKFEHISDYYKVVFVSRYADKSFLYETRHAAIKSGTKNNWPKNFINISTSKEREIIAKEYEYINLPNNLQNYFRGSNFDNFYINQLIINFTKDDFINRSQIISKDLFGLKLPKYLNHINTNIFYDEQENELNLITSEDKIKLKASQGYLENINSFDIGNIKSGYLVLKKTFIEKFLNVSDFKLILKIKSPLGTSIIRTVKNNGFTYFIQTSKNDRVTITTPYSNNFSIKQNNKKIAFSNSSKPTSGFIEFNSNIQGISKIDFNYKNHIFSNISFPVINFLLSLSTILLIIFLLKNTYLF